MEKIGYTDYQVTAGETYFYKVDAMDDLGNASNLDAAVAFLLTRGVYLNLDLIANRRDYSR
jgi:hypothetical protein